MNEQSRFCEMHRLTQILPHAEDLTAHHHPHVAIPERRNVTVRPGHTPHYEVRHQGGLSTEHQSDYRPR